MLEDPSELDLAAGSEMSPDPDTQRAFERFLEANEPFRAVANQQREPVRVAYEGLQGPIYGPFASMKIGISSSFMHVLHVRTDSPVSLYRCILLDIFTY